MKKSTQAIIDDCLINIANHLPGFKHRAGQQQMIQAVAKALSSVQADFNDKDMPINQGDSILVIEGPTGIGKSIGYLLPALVMAKEHGKKLVISSATIMLQEQLANKDVPLVAKHAGLLVSYVIAKGRGRYACTYRLKQLAGLARQGELAVKEPSQFELTDFHTATSETDADLYFQLAKLFVSQQWSGDRDSLEKPISNVAWSRITTDRHACLKRHCPEFNNCPFYVARNAMEKVDLIIANHDLLLSDIAMGGGVILPHPSEAFYCLDEAHHIADKAIKQFAATHTFNGTLAWLGKVEVVVNKSIFLLKGYNPVSNIGLQAETVASLLQDIKRAIVNFPELNPTDKPPGIPALYRFKQGKLPEALTELSDNLARATKSLLLSLNLLVDYLEKHKAAAEGQGIAAQFDRPLIDLGFLISRVENLVVVWSLYAMQTPEQMPPIAKWITAEWIFNKDKSEMIEYYFHAAPVNVANQLTEKFWHNVAGAVLTSATLRSLGKFDLLLTETGLNQLPATTCIALESPFNLRQQGKLIIPTMRTDPKDQNAHTYELIQLLPQLLTMSKGKGSLILFTSQSQMQKVIQNLPADIRALLLVQGQLPKDILLTEHFTRINNAKPSVLCGLASFAEGLDLPGDACNLVIIAKIPFAVPDEPIGLTYSEWISQKGGDPFMEMSLPAASIKLIQAVGRLIRTETDTGTVVICDNRLETKRYGKLLRNALPVFERSVIS